MAESWTKQHFRLDITSRCPLKAAWCSAVRPALSDTFTLLSSGTRASAQRTALFAAAIWSGVCQFLSRAFTSAECLSNTWTASCKKSSHVRLSCKAFRFLKTVLISVLSGIRAIFTYLTAGGHSPVQRSEPLVIFGIYSGTYKSEDTGCQVVYGHTVMWHHMQCFHKKYKSSFVTSPSA